MNELALFAGAGGGILGGKLLGWRTVCAVEWEPYPASVLIARQNDGLLPSFPVWDDVCTFDGKPWRGIVDVVSGGFPCQDISCAGKGAGITGEQSGLWKEMARIIGEVRPRYVFAENSPMLRTRGLNVVLKDLAEMGYDARWGVISAENAGASHKRERMWIVASNADERRSQGSNIKSHDKERAELSKILAPCPFPNSLDVIPKPYLFGTGNGVADRVDRTKAVGNGQVPLVVGLAWETLTSGI
jgi:DNA (cytosine-5)-methyltransferase 1